jgi:hypothetical protein
MPEKSPEVTVTLEEIRAHRDKLKRESDDHLRKLRSDAKRLKSTASRQRVRECQRFSDGEQYAISSLFWELEKKVKR